MGWWGFAKREEFCRGMRAGRSLGTNPPTTSSEILLTILLLLLAPALPPPIPSIPLPPPTSPILPSPPHTSSYLLLSPSSSSYLVMARPKAIPWLTPGPMAANSLMSGLAKSSANAMTIAMTSPRRPPRGFQSESLQRRRRRQRRRRQRRRRRSYLL